MFGRQNVTRSLRLIPVELKDAMMDKEVAGGGEVRCVLALG